MQIEYLVQPEIQIGRIFNDLISTDPIPKRVILVSAFVNRQTLLRIKEPMLRLFAKGTQIRLVIGVDMGGTSLEALKELLSWEVEVIIVKNRRQGHTFHPKMFLIEELSGAFVVVGSHNLTDGGFYRNYECGVKITYHFPGDEDQYHEALADLNRFINPSNEVSSPLSQELLEFLYSNGYIPTETEARRAARTAGKHRSRGGQQLSGSNPFGVERIPPPPAIPSQVISDIIRSEGHVRSEKDTSETQQMSETLHPTSFFMELHAMRSPENPTIPGEVRIPLAARDSAPSFWGWPDNYELSTSPRSGRDRRYHNWRPQWSVIDGSNQMDESTEEVRMYLYENSSDFRFYAPKLIQLGAKERDILKITRLYDEDVEFECVLARNGTTLHTQWQEICTIPVRNQGRKWGYA